LQTFTEKKGKVDEKATMMMMMRKTTDGTPEKIGTKRGGEKGSRSTRQGDAGYGFEDALMGGRLFCTHAPGGYFSLKHLYVSKFLPNHIIPSSSHKVSKFMNEDATEYYFPPLVEMDTFSEEDLPKGEMISAELFDGGDDDESGDEITGGWFMSGQCVKGRQGSE
jgi:hypothetical protein